MIKQKAFIARLFQRAGICDLGIRLIPGRRRYYSGYYKYINEYDNKIFPDTSGFVMILQIRSKIYIAGGFSSIQSVKLGNPATIWHSTNSITNSDGIVEYQYTIKIFDGSDGLYRNVNSKGSLWVKLFDMKGRPKELAEEFENPKKGKGTCRYIHIDRSDYYNAKQAFNSKKR